MLLEVCWDESAGDRKWERISKYDLRKHLRGEQSRGVFNNWMNVWHGILQHPWAANVYGDCAYRMHPAGVGVERLREETMRLEDAEYEKRIQDSP